MKMAMQWKVTAWSFKLPFHQNRKTDPGLNYQNAHPFETRKDTLIKFQTRSCIKILCYLKLFSGP